MFKDNLKQSNGEWLLGEEHAMILARRLKKSSMSFLCQYIITTWQGISPKVTVKWFKSGVYPLSNDNMWWNDSEQVGKGISKRRWCMLQNSNWCSEQTILSKSIISLPPLMFSKCLCIFQNFVSFNHVQFI